MSKLETLLKLYDYSLDQNLIAQAPATPRDFARLLVYKKSSSKVIWDHFYNIGKYLPKNSVVVFNQTKVVPARLALQKPTGGKVEILYLESKGELIKVLANKKLLEGQTLLLISKSKLVLSFKVINKEIGSYWLQPEKEIQNFSKILEQYGSTPLPPYIKQSKLTEKQRRKEYQTVFAKAGMSVAAPTASLHFTKKLIQELKRQGIEIKFVTLNVNLGTFAPLKEENIKTGRLHLETYEIEKKTADFLTQAKKENRNIIAVGTTVVRTLESAAKKDKLVNLKGDTRLFIMPGYKFKFINSIITNFHVPKSSLLMLVSALVGRRKLMALYKQAIKKQFRFFSFGDGMLILP